MAVLQRLSFFAGLTFLAACGSTTAAAGNALPGGEPGKPCAAASAPVGCYVDPASGTNTIVSCPADVSPATWVAGQSCPTGQHCTVKSKTEAACVDNPVATVPDTISSGDTGKSDGSAESACVQAKCAKETAACLASPKCNTFMTCLAACKDKTCQDACATPIKGDAAATKAVQDIFQCSINAGMACSGGGDAGSTDTGKTDTGPSQDVMSGMDTSSGASCGDRTCQTSETAESCPFDCNSAYASQADCIAQACGSGWSGCQANSMCAFGVNCSLACAGDSSCLSACQSDATDSLSKSMFACCAQNGCWAGIP